MATRPDKQQVIDEIWDEERIAAFLHKAPLTPGENPDFSVLVYAYRSMRPADFGRFIQLYRSAGRDISARGSAGLTLRETIAGHRLAAPFLEIIGQHGV
ncbi:MAG: PA4642 family protein [Gammaproteobacteria bacterium]